MTELFIVIATVSLQHCIKRAEKTKTESGSWTTNDLSCVMTLHRFLFVS